MKQEPSSQLGDASATLGGVARALQLPSYLAEHLEVIGWDGVK